MLAMDTSGLLLVGIGIRLMLLVYGQWQDSTQTVKFTDIDYNVFHDAAQFLAQGKSPYMRATYRYTPLLAYILLPNVYISPMFGKLLFVLFDVATASVIYCLVLATGETKKMAKICCCLWLFNPLPMTVSCRGNAESIMSFLVVSSLYLLYKRKLGLAGAVYALSIHFKIYPVVYALPIYLLLGRGYREGFGKEEEEDGYQRIRNLLFPTWDRLVFILSGASTLLTLTALFYYLYGWEFLFHTYFYHIVRSDIRHNFSVYFYMLYLTSGTGQSSLLISLVAFVPQVLLLTVLSWRFYRNPPMAFLVNTLIFVAFNKVCTSQYFLWYLCLLPLTIPNFYMSKTTAFVATSLWFAGQGLWLLPAYYLEFEGYNTFLYIWMAGLVYFLINVYILCLVVMKYKEAVWFSSYTKISSRSPSRSKFTKLKKSRS